MLFHFHRSLVSPFRLRRRIGPRPASPGADAMVKAERGGPPFVEPERRSRSDRQPLGDNRQKGIQKWVLNQLLTQIKTVAVLILPLFSPPLFSLLYSLYSILSPLFSILLSSIRGVALVGIMC